MIILKLVFRTELSWKDELSTLERFFETRVCCDDLRVRFVELSSAFEFGYRFHWGVWLRLNNACFRRCTSDWITVFIRLSALGAY